MYRDIVLNDIETILGSEMICKKVIISKDKSCFIGGNQNEEIINSTIKNIKELIKNSPDEFTARFNMKRLSNYIGGIATIYVGGYSAVEIQEKKDRLEDAICAVKAAMTDGILPGGGLALYKASLQLADKLEYLNDVLKAPYNKLSALSECDYKMNMYFWDGVNLKTNEQGNMYTMGIVDPFLVTKIALENAVSTASLLLTNGCTIINTNN